MSSNSSEDSPPSPDSPPSKDSSPPSPSSSSSSSSPPPSSSSSSSPPPPDDSSSSSPPPKDSDSPPPPSDDNSPPSSDNNSPPPPSNNNNSPPSNNNNNNPPPDSNNNSPPNSDNNSSPSKNKSPPPPSWDSSNNGSPSPPPPPPPPPSHSGALSPPRKSTPSSHTPSKGDSSDETAIIAGAAAGAALLLIFMIVCLVACTKKKKRRSHDEMHYYRDNSHINKNNGYYNNASQHGHWTPQPQSTDFHVKMPPPPGSAAVSSEYGWLAAPPPPPPMMSSSEMSSAAYSGPYGAALPPPHPGLALGFNKSTFTYDDLAAATGNFARTNLLGQGGFGYVHKGVLPNGKEIAVKSLKSGSGQGEREFQAEVDIISRVHHRHLVSLVGYCIAGNQRLLVYEFVPNNTLEFHLHGENRPVMDCTTRLRIALGSAKGFAYLHEDCHPRIIHRDIKAANILIDNQFEAKVADFGLAKLSNDNNTHVSTRIMGTFGYLAPEYASSGKLTEKSDVYSYGVVLLELITGKRPVDATLDDDTLIDWARPLLMHASDGGSFEELVDPRLENNYDREEMHRLVACAAACIRHSARRRPKMSQIVRALEGDVSLEDLNEGVRPGHSAMFGSMGGSSEYDSHSYNGEMKKFRKAAGGTSSQEYTSSEHGATGEFVHSSGESQEMRPRSRFNSP